MSKKKKVIFSILSFAFVAILSCGVIFLPDWSQKDEGQKNMLSETEAATTPTNTSGTWIDSGRRGTSFGGGSGTESDPYLISNAQQLAYLSYRVDQEKKYNYKGVYFKQTANIDLSAYYWYPIGPNDGRPGGYAFSGNYDGGEYTISGLFTQSGKSYQGLFGYCYNANISNVGIIDGFIQGTSYVAGIVASGGAIIHNCFNNASIEGEGDYIAGIASSVSVIDNCYNHGDVVGLGGSYVGGVIGNVYLGMKKCSNTGSVQGSSFVGGVAGESGGDVENCSNSGFVEGSSYVGGIIGNDSSSTEIKYCVNTASISGMSNVGGIVGRSECPFDWNIESCYNTGSITATEDQVGGIVGYCDSRNIKNCYNSGNVIGRSYVGGIVGTIQLGTVGLKHRFLSNCYNSGSIKCSSSGVGGIVGNVERYYKNSVIVNCFNLGKASSSVNGAAVGGIVGMGSSTISSCYYGYNCSSSVGGVNGADTTGAKYLSGIYSLATSSSWYTTSSNWNSAYPWDLDKVWFVGESLPELRMELIYDYDFSGYSLVGSGSSSDPYRIRSEQDLAFLSWTIVENKPYGHTPSGEGNSSSPRFFYSNKYFRQENDLDFSNLGWWQPIGVDLSSSPTDEYNYFSGNYDGQGFDIIGIVTEGSSQSAWYRGLFGVAGGASTNLPATIKNVNMKSCYIRGYDYSGGILGKSEGNCHISNCSVAGVVNDRSYSGGIIGEIDSSILNTRIENCVNYATIQGNSEIGGILGLINGLYGGSQAGVTKVNDIVIENCVNFGNIIGDAVTGGIAGYASAIGIKNCLNVGDVTSLDSIAGGIVGTAVNGDMLLQNCLNLGDVSGGENYEAGGLIGSVGLTIGNVIIENCGTEGKVESAGVVGGFVGSFSSLLNLYDSTFKMTNCFASVEMTGSAIIGEYDNSEGEISYDKIVMLVNGTTKRYVGSDFSAFIWINSSSCPVLKSFAWLQSLWPSTVTETNLRNAGWTKVSV